MEAISALASLRSILKSQCCLVQAVGRLYIQTCLDYQRCYLLNRKLNVPPRMVV